MTRNWLSRFAAACGLLYVIIAVVASGSGDDNAPTSNWSGQAIAAYAATHQAGPSAGLGEMVALLLLAAVIVLVGGVLTVAIKLGSFPAFLPCTARGRGPIPRWRAR
jgi:hypothetical protein